MMPEIGKTDKLLLNKYYSCIAHNTRELRIEDEDLIGFPEDFADLPEVLSCMLEIIDIGAKDSPNMIMTSAFSNAANLMSRFAHLDPVIYEGCQEIVTKEEESLEKDAVIAEIVHLPEARVGNVVCRPSFRRHEIPYLAPSSVDCDHQIPVDDIMVSVRGGREILLRSRKLNKRIIPRLVSAHNYNHESLAIYEFLASMQYPSLRAGLSFSWPSLIRSAKYFPRVRYKNTVLAPERWIIGKGDWEILPDVNDEKFEESFQTLKSNRRICNRIFVVQGDNRLLIDLSNIFSVRFMCLEYRDREVIIEEVLFEGKNAAVLSDSGSGHTNQVIISFFKKKN